MCRVDLIAGQAHHADGCAGALHYARKALMAAAKGLILRPRCIVM